MNRDGVIPSTPAPTPGADEIQALARRFALTVLTETADRVTGLQRSGSTPADVAYNDGIRDAFKEVCKRIGVTVACRGCSWSTSATYALASLVKHLRCPHCNSRDLNRTEVVL